MKQFRGVFLKFTDKTSVVVPKKEGDKEVWPKVTLKVKVNNSIPFKHRICR